ncbi:MAG: hypothetical protein KA731_01655 [Candidatus Moranbacteria bacterium]|nr:hypothetical protein [Candidatus Moranbacteria bacterium]
MQWFQIQQRVGFIDGQTLRVARLVARGVKRTLMDEQKCAFSPEGKSTVVEACHDCDGRIRLVVAEEGVYTFAVSLPLSGIFARPQVEEALQSCFPESSQMTLWDYRVISRGEHESLLEVTEMKASWRDTLSDLSATQGLVFESIIPESSALAALVHEEQPVLIIHRKDAVSTLLVCCESGKVSASVLMKKADFSGADITGFLEFCQQKKQKLVTKIYCSGFESVSLGQLPAEWEVADMTLDPLLGASLASRWHRDDTTLDFSDAVPRPWYRNFF